MVVFPNAKINLGLNVIEKRLDGYHNIESCFYPIPFTDALEVIESETLSFSSSGIDIPGDQSDNLCLKAYHLIKEEFDIPPVAIHLHKHIPIGAGLGGGSSDGAFMIKLLNEKFDLGISLDNQEKFASQLGSDCPFFIRNKPVYVEGTGSKFSNINLSLQGKHLVLVMPNIHVSTADAYAGVMASKPKSRLKDTLETVPFIKLQHAVKNDFEGSVFQQYPELEQLKLELIEQGASYASMTGSGAAVFGLFDYKPEFASNYAFEVVQL